jgi:hypothetical protein
VIEPLDVTSASIRARHRLRRFGKRTLSRASARSGTASLAPRGGVHITLELRDPDAGSVDSFSDARSRLRAFSGSTRCAVPPARWRVAPNFAQPLRASGTSDRLPQDWVIELPRVRIHPKPPIHPAPRS